MNTFMHLPSELREQSREAALNGYRMWKLANRPLQQTKPRTILCAFTHRVRGFAAQRQVVSQPT
jgi:hypothetical protein